MIKTILSTTLMFLFCLVLISSSIGGSRYIEDAQAETNLNANLEAQPYKSNKINPEILSQINLREELIENTKRKNEAEMNIKVQSLERFIIASKGSKGFASASKTIIESSERCGVNYKLMVAIAGYESGFGAAPHRKYNPFGWLNGVQYNSWNEAVSDIICDFSHGYTKKGLNKPEDIVRIYVGTNGNKEKWVANVSNIMNKVP